VTNKAKRYLYCSSISFCSCTGHCSAFILYLSWITSTVHPLIIIVWHCVILVRQGFYKEGKFKFVMQFTAEFPKVPPKVMFLSKMYHPLVDYNTGDLDIGRIFSKWNYIQENMLYTVFNQIKLLFTDQEKLCVTDSFNPDAGRKFSQKIHVFLERVIECVEASKESLYHNEEDSSLIMRADTNADMEGIKKKVKEVCQVSGSFEDKKKLLMEYLTK
jgi:ubiquitin-protein ligase